MSKTNAINKLKETMEVMEQIEPLVEHYFSEGIYARLMTLNAGDSVVGKQHKKGHLAILLEGEVSVSSKYGTAIYKAPYIVQSMPGDRRAFIAHTPSKWLTIHATSETNVARIEQELVEDE